jgi:hypothetical protein
MYGYVDVEVHNQFANVALTSWLPRVVLVVAVEDTVSLSLLAFTPVKVIEPSAGERMPQIT